MIITMLFPGRRDMRKLLSMFSLVSAICSASFLAIKSAKSNTSHHSTFYDWQFLYSRCLYSSDITPWDILFHFLQRLKNLCREREGANTFNFLQLWIWWWLFFTGRRHVQTPTRVWWDGLRIVPGSRMNNHGRSSRLIESIRVHLLVLMVWFER